MDCFDKSLNQKINYSASVGKVIVLKEKLKKDNFNANIEVEIIDNLKKACLINNDGYLLEYKIYKELNQFQDSLLALEKYIDNYDKSIQNHENYLDILFDMGDLNYLLSRYDESFYYFYKFLKFDENNVLMAMGFLAPHLDKYDYALKCFDKIFEINHSIYSMLYKGELLISLHKYDEGINCLNLCPSELLPYEYKQLLKYAEDQIIFNNPTEYFGVTYDDSKEYRYAFTFINDKFRKIYANSLLDLRLKMSKFDFPLKIIKYDVEFNSRDYIKCYYKLPYCLVEYNELIGSILNNVFIEKYNYGNINIEELFDSKNDIEKDIIKILINIIDDNLNYVNKHNDTGFFGVVRNRKSDNINWSYVDLVRAEFEGWKIIYAKTLEELEKLVSDKNSLWYVFDDALAKQSRILDKKLSH